MFTFYLLGLCFWPPWREQCNRPATYMVFIRIHVITISFCFSLCYFKVPISFAFLQFIDPNIEDDNFYAEANTSLVSIKLL